MKRKIGIAIAAILYAGIAMAQKPVASFPFEQYGDHSFIKVKVNGSEELDFIFDTGDGLTVLNIARAKELGMASGSDATTTSAEGTISGKLVKHNELTVGGAPIHNIKVYETVLTHLEISIGKDIDGIIGYDILKNYVVSMNYDKKKIDLYDPATYKYKGKGTMMGINLTSFIPHIMGQVTLENGEKVMGEFFVDTGAKATIDFNTPFVESNDLTSKVGDSYIYLVAGLGDTEYEHHRGRVKSFAFENFAFTDMPVGLSHAKSGIQNHKKVAGIIGSGVLSKFNIVYNYAQKKMYWEKSDTYDDAFVVNASGIELQLSKDKSQVLVHKVFENSPAFDAGIEVDTAIDAIDGQNAIDLGLAQLRDLLSEDGGTVVLTIAGEEIELQLKKML
ncbi:aspartyl protease family protein [Reichenbachiella carrageenanivorans]|uniref:Aspartyl protease family protein n=1 Tax=Reichenbachiella carrageenanivorans TaxID=2979869 RepID=A0ABY6CW69_9BACT|nr:aspartyl protease family protein [Reichenbachiella carrageenanivorans]UXX78161.1 aspartyl protease family protein [Reichenbachiella carrageenanivorans]